MNIDDLTVLIDMSPRAAGLIFGRLKGKVMFSSKTFVITR